MIRFDLVRAGLPFVNDIGEVFNFHALGVQCGTNLAGGGAHPALAQRRLRHSTMELTMRVYTKLGKDEQHGAALKAMPTLSIGA